LASNYEPNVLNVIKLQAKAPLIYHNGNFFSRFLSKRSKKAAKLIATIVEILI
jgi:hypothetical protein